MFLTMSDRTTHSHANLMLEELIIYLKIRGFQTDCQIFHDGFKLKDRLLFVFLLFWAIQILWCLFILLRIQALKSSLLQAEYMSRLDYKWKHQLSQEQEESSTMHMINKMLLQNILPVHVGKN
jgi:hypothetical protein